MLSLLIGFSFPVHAATITVGAGGDYSTISDAISAAESDDEIVVSSGTYEESVDFAGKSLTLRSESGPVLTTIAPSGSLAAITIDSG